MKREQRIKVRRICYRVGYLTTVIYRLIQIIKSFRKGD